jgi:hypothetical protein
MPLSGEQWERLNNFIANHFNHMTLAQMLQFRLNKKLANITLPVAGATMTQIAFDVINTAEMETSTIRMLPFFNSNTDICPLPVALPRPTTSCPAGLSSRSTGTIYNLRNEGWVVAERRHSKSDETGSGEPMANELD